MTVIISSQAQAQAQALKNLWQEKIAKLEREKLEILKQISLIESYPFGLSNENKREIERLNFRLEMTQTAQDDHIFCGY